MSQSGRSCGGRTSASTTSTARTEKTSGRNCTNYATRSGTQRNWGQRSSPKPAMTWYSSSPRSRTRSRRESLSTQRGIRYPRKTDRRLRSTGHIRTDRWGSRTSTRSQARSRAPRCLCRCPTGRRSTPRRPSSTRSRRPTGTPRRARNEGRAARTQSKRTEIKRDPRPTATAEAPSTSFVAAAEEDHDAGADQEQAAEQAGTRFADPDKSGNATSAPMAGLAHPDGRAPTATTTDTRRRTARSRNGRPTSHRWTPSGAATPCSRPDRPDRSSPTAPSGAKIHIPHSSSSSITHRKRKTHKNHKKIRNTISWSPIYFTPMHISSCSTNLVLTWITILRGDSPHGDLPRIKKRHTDSTTKLSHLVKWLIAQHLPQTDLGEKRSHTHPTNLARDKPERRPHWRRELARTGGGVISGFAKRDPPHLRDTPTNQHSEPIIRRARQARARGHETNAPTATSFLGVFCTSEVRSARNVRNASARPSYNQKPHKNGSSCYSAASRIMPSYHYSP